MAKSDSPMLLQGTLDLLILRTLLLGPASLKTDLTSLSNGLISPSAAARPKISPP